VDKSVDENRKTVDKCGIIEGMGKKLTLRFWGEAEVRVAGRPLLAPLSKKGILLLAMLATEQGKSITRTRLASLLWPDSLEETALSNLRRILTALRMTLGEAGDCIISPTSRTLALSVESVEADIWNDALISGNKRVFLEGMHDEWVLEERTRLESLSPTVTSLTPSLPRRDNLPRHDNLPHAITSFVGRVKEQAQVTEALTSHRLVTLTGTGGTGKTRLSLQVAKNLVPEYPDGVWLVELAPLMPPTLLSQPDLFLQAVAKVLNVREQAGESLLQTLQSHLQEKHLLILLDNCEHLLDVCASFVAALLQSCPHVHVLATSREALGVYGEKLYRVPSLSQPSSDHDQSATVESLSVFESVQLFWERALLVKHDFALTSANVPATAQLCQRLDGIPLALELAAARTRILSVEEINHRLESCFCFLTVGDRTAPARHQTLRALVDWSYDLLTESEKILLCRVSVFAGGWTPSACASVCGFAPLESEDMLDLLTSLSDKSLVLVGEKSNSIEMRYGMLETIRQYGRDRLQESGQDTALRERHQAYFVTLAEEAEQQKGADEHLWMSRLEAEYDNFRVALAWLGASDSESGANDSENVLRLCGLLGKFWFVRGYFREGGDHCRVALERVPQATKSSARARALHTAGSLAYQRADYELAQSAHEESLAVWRVREDPKGIAMSLYSLGNVANMQGNYSVAGTLLEEALGLQREMGSRRGIANTLSSLGNVADNQGDYEYAHVLLEESLAIKREDGNQIGIAVSLASLGVVATSQGNYATARSFLEESLALEREHHLDCSISLLNLGIVAFYQGDYASSGCFYRESLEIAWKQGALRVVTESLTGLFSLAVTRKNRIREGWVRAARLGGAIVSQREEHGLIGSPREQQQFEYGKTTVRQSLGAEAFTIAWEEGRQLTLDQSVALAYAYDSRNRHRRNLHQGQFFFVSQIS
jgi:predicted ATPase